MNEANFEKIKLRFQIIIRKIVIDFLKYLNKIPSCSKPKIIKLAMLRANVQNKFHSLEMLSMKQEYWQNIGFTLQIYLLKKYQFTLSHIPLKSQYFRIMGFPLKKLVLNWRITPC